VPASPPGKARYPLYKRLGGPWASLDSIEILSPLGFDPWSVLPIASSYTGYAILVTRLDVHYLDIGGHTVVQFVQALRYKPAGRRFNSQWCHWNFSLT